MKSPGPDLLRIVLASTNKHKYGEFREFFESDERLRDRVELVGPERLGVRLPGEIEENGDSYEANALIKARAWAKAANMPAIADDSGIEVRALDWAPGIHSARAAVGGDADRVKWLLEKLDGVADRRACFVASLVIAFPADFARGGRDYFAAAGRCWGTVAEMPSVEEGFGYDPVFIPDGYELSFSVLGPQIKSKISHRAIALEGIGQIMPSVIQYLTVCSD